MTADAAQVSPDGKVSMLGGDFDTVNALRFPLQYDLTLVMRLDFAIAECGREYRLRITFNGQLGSALAPALVSPFTPMAPKGHGDRPVRLAFSIGISGLVFQTPGTYRFNIAVDEQALGTVPLYLARLPAQPSGPLT